MTLAAIDFGQLFELVWAAALAGVVVAGSFALGLVGFARAAERRADRQGALATAYGVLGFLGIGLFLAAVVFGISVIVAK